MKKIIYLSLLFTLFNSYTCTNSTDKCHKTMHFNNQTTRDVYIYHSTDCMDSANFWIPNLNSNSNRTKVKSYEKEFDILWSRSCYEKYLEKNCVVIYVFDAEIIETVPRDSIIKYFMVLKTIRPTLADMERDNWTITFTGD